MVAKPIPDTSHRILIAGLVIAAMSASFLPEARAEADVNTEAMAVIDRALKRYRSLNTYQDRIAREFVLVARDPDGRDASRHDRSTNSLVYGGPNRFLTEDDLLQVKIYRDQDRLWTIFRDIYTESTTTGPTDFADAVPTFLRPPVREFEHPVVLVLNHPDAGFADLFPMVSSVTNVESQERQGAAGKLVKGTIEIFKGRDNAQQVPFSAWFDDADDLLREVVIDVTKTMKEALAERPREPGKPAVAEKCHLTMRLDRIVTDDELPEGHFTFKPGNDYVRVPSITPDAYQKALIGRPAPQILSKSEEGKPFSLKEHRGRVVVIDFWASWCRPCIELLPILQMISDKFADDSVAFVGVNTDDQPEGIAIAREILADRNITIRQIWDTDFAVFSSYRLYGILPCTIIVGPKGLVQAIHFGFAPMELFADVQTLVRGGSLVGRTQPAEQLGRARR